MKNNQVESKIKKFLEEKLLINFTSEINSETNLFDRGLIDSYGYMELVKFMEREFGVQFSSEELVSNAFISLSNMEQIIQTKAKAG